MKIRLAWTGICLLALGVSCHSKKGQEETAETQSVTEEKTAETPPAPGDDATGATAVKSKRPSLELYPPIYTIYPLSQPEPEHPFYFGYAADAERPFQTVFSYVAAVEPNFQSGEAAPPVILDSYAYANFMSDWAQQFQKQPEMVQKLKDLAASFAWQVDSQYIDDKAEPIPDRVLDDQPLYMRQTQITMARRFTFKMPGTTEIKGELPSGPLRIGINIKAYTQAQINVGKARYAKVEDPCVSCHAGPEATRGAYLKHSSDFMAYFTDAQLVEMIKNSNNPDGSPFLEGTHLHPLADAAEEEGMIAFLRNMLPWYDKAQSLSGTVGGTYLH